VPVHVLSLHSEVAILFNKSRVSSGSRHVPTVTAFLVLQLLISIVSVNSLFKCLNIMAFALLVYSFSLVTSSGTILTHRSAFCVGVWTCVLADANIFSVFSGLCFGYPRPPWGNLKATINSEVIGTCLSVLVVKCRSECKTNGGVISDWFSETYTWP
jgi:hypothetical protein